MELLIQSINYSLNVKVLVLSNLLVVFAIPNSRVLPVKLLHPLVADDWVTLVDVVLVEGDLKCVWILLFYIV